MLLESLFYWLFGAHAVVALILFSAVVFLFALILFWKSPLTGFLAVISLLPFEKLGSYSLNPALGHPMVRLVQVASGALLLSFGFNILLGEKVRKILSLRYLLLFLFSALISAVLVNYFRVWQKII